MLHWVKIIRVSFQSNLAGLSAAIVSSSWIASAAFCSKIIIVVSFLMALTFGIWSLDRGFAITDEAYYLLLAMHPTSVKAYVSAQQWVTGPLWTMTGNLIAFRSVGMLILILGACILSFGAIDAFCKETLNTFDRFDARLYVFFSAITSALLYGSTINFSPCYNLLAAAAAYSSSGLVLLAVYSESRRDRILALIGSGFCLSVEAVCKPSAGIATLSLLILWVVLLDKSTLRKTYTVLSLVVACCLSSLVLFFTQTNLSEARIALCQGFELFRMVQVEPIPTRLIRYFTELSGNLFSTIQHFFFVAVAMTLHSISRKPLFVWLIFVILAGYLAFGQYYLGGCHQYNIQIESAVVLLLIMLWSSFSAWRSSKRTITLIFGLIVLPYTVAVGTGNSIFTQIIVSLAPWGVVIASLASIPNKQKSDELLSLGILAFFVLMLTSQIVTSGTREPYDLNCPLSQQSHNVRIANLGRVKVDYETKKFVDELSKIEATNHLSANQTFLGLYNIPGVSLPLGLTTSVTPWINNLQQAEMVTKQENSENLPKMVLGIMMNSDGSTPILPSSLKNFPKQFRLCGSVIYPIKKQKIEIWQRL